MLYADKLLKALPPLKIASSIADSLSYNDKINILILLSNLIELLQGRRDIQLSSKIDIDEAIKAIKAISDNKVDKNEIPSSLLQALRKPQRQLYWRS